MLVSLRPNGKEFSLTGSSIDSAHNSSSALKSKFARKVQDFVYRHGLDGVDLDWEFFRDQKDSSNSKENLINQLRLFRSMLNQITGGPEEYIVSLTTSKYPRELADNYDFNSLQK